MFDIHTHLLFGIDDGAADIEISKRMLEVMREIGTETVVCTPHFKRSVSELGAFVRDREAAFCTLEPIAAEYGIKLLRGAEVHYSPGLLGLDADAGALCIEGTRNILLEMPSGRLWNKTDYENISKFCDYYNVRPVIAHIERNYAVSKSLKYADELAAIGARFQLDASSVYTPIWSKLSKKLLKKGYISAIASDAHNVEIRTPEVLRTAYALIEKQFGVEFVRELKHGAAAFCES